MIRASTASPEAAAFTAKRTRWFRVQAAWWVRRYTGSLGKILTPSTCAHHLRAMSSKSRLGHVVRNSRSKSLHSSSPCTGRKGACVPMRAQS